MDFAKTAPSIMKYGVTDLFEYYCIRAWRFGGYTYKCDLKSIS